MAGLKESRRVRQIPGESRRRWFSSSEMDLAVWVDDRGEINGFELCYDKAKAERALRWKRGSGFLHERVDDGEGRPGRHKATPVLVPDGVFDAKKISRLFAAASRDIDQTIADFVYRRLLEYPERP
jgi:hypothetical protein